MPSVADDRLAFVEKHGGLKLTRRLNTLFWVFPDGALLAHHSLAENFEPPADEIKRVTLIRDYQRIIYREAVEEFEQCERMIRCHFDPSFRGEYCGPTFYGDRQDGLNALRAKRRVVWNAKYLLEEVSRKLDSLINPPHVVKQREKSDAESKSAERHFFDELRKLTL